MNGAADSEDAGERLYAAAVAHAQSRGFHLGDGADQYFRQRSGDAARQLAGAANDDGFDLAIANARALIDAMIAARPAAYADDPDRLASNIIGEVTLGEALAKLCPIWPFC